MVLPRANILTVWKGDKIPLCHASKELNDVIWCDNDFSLNFCEKHLLIPSVWRLNFNFFFRQNPQYCHSNAMYWRTGFTVEFNYFLFCVILNRIVGRTISVSLAWMQCNLNNELLPIFHVHKFVFTTNFQIHRKHNVNFGQFKKMTDNWMSLEIFISYYFLEDWGCVCSLPNKFSYALCWPATEIVCCLAHETICQLTKWMQFACWKLQLKRRKAISARAIGTRMICCCRFFYFFILLRVEIKCPLSNGLWWRR